MDIAEAQAVLQAEANKLTDALHAKGYDHHAQIWVGRKSLYGTCTIYCEGSHFIGQSGNDLALILSGTHEQIAAMPHKDADALAYAEELSQPLWLMSEHA